MLTLDSAALPTTLKPAPVTTDLPPVTRRLSRMRQRLARVTRRLPHVALFIPYVSPAMGGPVHAMAGYSGLLAQQGCSVLVFGASQDSDGPPVALHPKVFLVEGANATWGSLRHSAALWEQSQAADFELIHSLGMWTDVQRLAAHTSRRRDLPHLLAPCGMLQPGARQHHWWKKAMVQFWFADRALREAQCLHAKSEREYEQIRQYGLRNPVVIIANPIVRPPEQERISSAEFCAAHPVVGDRKIALFLGRLHRVKGVERLVEAWSTVCRQYPEWVLAVAGPNEGGHQQELESRIAELGCAESIMFTGELGHRQKWGALGAAELFVMPSDYENFGNSIVEAMLCRVPVITTTGTPWKELPALGAGWCVEPSPEALALALREALDMPDQEREAMGRRAADLAKRFCPERAVSDLIQVYNWLLDRDARPACVRME